MYVTLVNLKRNLGFATLVREASWVLGIRSNRTLGAWRSRTPSRIERDAAVVTLKFNGIDVVMWRRRRHPAALRHLIENPDRIHAA